VFHEGDEGENFYIIEEGEVECLKKVEGGGYELIRTLGQGSHFGEVAIIQNVTRTLSIKASAPITKLLVLTREAFQRVVGSIR